MSIISKDRDNNTIEWMKTLFNTYEDGLNGEKSLSAFKFRKENFELLKESGFPTRKDEDWKYTNVTPIITPNYHFGKAADVNQEEVDACLYEGLDTFKLVFVNGVLNEAHSDLPQLNGLTFLHIDEAMEDEAMRSSITSLQAQVGGTDKNTFIQINKTFSHSGYYIEVDKNTQIDKPIQFIYLNKANDSAHFTNPQIFVKANTSSEITIIESHHATADTAEYFTNALSYFHVGQNANVHHYRLQFESGAAYQINNAIIAQDRDSVYSNYAVDLGGKTVRNNMSTELKGPNTNTNYYGAYIGMEKQHIDNQTFIDHAVPHCESNELYKGILSDSAKGVFNGKVLVRQDAQKTNAFQQNSSLVLSDFASMDAKPQLEIFADDVKCSHGATIGQLDESSIFYLKSRGLTDTAARNILQKAFVGDVVSNFKHEEIKQAIFDKIDKKLERQL